MRQKKIACVIIFLMLTMTGFAQFDWQVKGDTIKPGVIEELGKTVCVSSDGNTIAVGNYHEISEYQRITIYNFVNNNWEFETDIYAYTPQYGSQPSKIKMSKDASRIIYAMSNYDNCRGLVKVFDVETGNQIGTDLIGDTEDDFFGQNISISGDGSLIACATGRYNSSGNHYIKTYEVTDSYLIPVPDEFYLDYYIGDIALNYDGTIMAFSQPQNNGGIVEVHQKYTTFWNEYGNAFSSSFSDFGYSLSLNNEGNIIAVGTSAYDDDAGRVDVYEIQNNLWQAHNMSDNTMSNFFYRHFGCSVELNGAGDMLIAGGKGAWFFDPPSGNNIEVPGRVRVLRNNNGTWEQLGEDMRGICANNDYDWFGECVSMSDDGYTVGVASSNFYGGYGAVLIYRAPIPVVEDQPTDVLDVCGGTEQTFYADGSTDTYQWQVSSDNGETFTDLTDNGQYSNTTYPSLHINEVTPDLDGNLYRCMFCSYDVLFQPSDTVLLSLESELPMVEVQNLTVELDNEGNAIIAADDIITNATDNCQLTDTTITQTDFNCSDVGNTIDVDVTVSDISGNFTSQTVEIFVEDNIQPVIECVGAQFRDADNASNTYTVQGDEFDPTNIFENCDYTYSNNYNNLQTLAGAILPEGTTIVTWEIENEHGVINSCMFTVTVNEYTGISDLNENLIQVFPNPTTSYVNISAENIDIQNIKLVDVYGQKTDVQTSQNSSDFKVDFPNQATGIYFLKIETKEGIITKKVIIK